MKIIIYNTKSNRLSDFGNMFIISSISISISLCACIRASPFSLLSLILVLSQVLRRRREEKLRSADAVLASKVDNISKNTIIQGYNQGRK